MFPWQTKSESEVHFDVETAIKVLRQAGYYSHALYLAENHAHHEWYLKIQLEDIKVGHQGLLTQAGPGSCSGHPWNGTVVQVLPGG